MPGKFIQQVPHAKDAKDGTKGLVSNSHDALFMKMHRSGFFSACPNLLILTILCVRRFCYLL